MGGAQSIDGNMEGNMQALPQLLESEEVDWTLVRECLHRSPEHALLYAHGIEPSMLSRAIKRSAPADVVELLIKCDEDAIHQLSDSGETILHASCNNGAAVRILLERHPDKASIKDCLGRLPLHLSKSPDAAKMLIEAFPQGLAQRSAQWGWLPLHHALSQDTVNPDLLRVLGDQDLYPIAAKGILSRDKKGSFPLKLLRDRLECNLVDDLWDVLQEWIFHLPRAGPQLHAHVEYGCCKTRSLMEKALQKFVGEAVERDLFGRTALHLAAINGQCDADALEALIRINPNAPRMTDNEGRLPIDVAAESPNTQPHCLALLMKGEPRAVNTRDLMNGYYPFLTSALSPQQNATNTYFLLRARPEVLSYYHTP